MKVAEQQKRRAYPSTQAAIRKGAPPHLRPRAPIAIAVLCAAAVTLGIILVQGGASHPLSTRHAAIDTGATVPSAVAMGSPRGRTALRWVNGLATGLVARSDVTARLVVQDPRTARIVMATWADLNASGGPARVRTAVSWLDGLAAGLVLRSDIASHLEDRDTRTAASVAAAWTDLT